MSIIQILTNFEIMQRQR